jgi:hypothetical protein
VRSLPSIVAGIVATLAAIVTVPLLWISLNVQDEDGFVELGNSLVADGDLQSALAAYLADDFVARGVLPAALQQTAASAMTSVVARTTDQSGFEDAWSESERSLHRSALDGSSGPITVDLAPVAGALAERVSDRLPVALPADTSLPVTVGDEQVRDRVQWIDRSRTGWMLGLIVVLIGTAVCVLGARTRGLGVLRAGVGALVTAGVLWSATSVVAPVLIDRAEGSSPFAKTLQRLLVDRASESLIGWLEPIAWTGLVAVAVGLVGHLVARRQTADD